MNKKLVFSIILILIVILVAVFSGKSSQSPNSASNTVPEQLPEDVSVEEGFQEAEQFINSRAPIKIDDETRLDKALAGPGDLMTYFYSLTQLNVAEVDAEQVLNDIKPKLLSSLCSNAEMQPVLKAGARMVYVYSDQNGEDVGEIEVIESDCQS